MCLAILVNCVQWRRDDNNMNHWVYLLPTCSYFSASIVSRLDRGSSTNVLPLSGMPAAAAALSCNTVRLRQAPDCTPPIQVDPVFCHPVVRYNCMMLDMVHIMIRIY